MAQLQGVCCSCGLLPCLWWLWFPGQTPTKRNDTTIMA